MRNLHGGKSVILGSAKFGLTSRLSTVSMGGADYSTLPWPSWRAAQCSQYLVYRNINDLVTMYKLDKTTNRGTLELTRFFHYNSKNVEVIEHVFFCRPKHYRREIRINDMNTQVLQN